MIFSSNAVFPPAIWYSDIIEHTEMVLNIIFLKNYSPVFYSLEGEMGSCKWLPICLVSDSGCRLSCAWTFWTQLLSVNNEAAAPMWCSNNHAWGVSMRKENSPVPSLTVPLLTVPLLTTATTLTFTKLALSRNP